VEARINDLEIKLAYAEDQIDELNRTVFHQQQQFDALQHELRTLRQQMQANQPGEARNLREEIPPHY